ncbi:hypothetical protein J6590_040509 [Homalodisca vitripennis]|nr:hypothetical protein J6590_040509 [Homalodisca vitripennis]
MSKPTHMGNSATIVLCSIAVNPYTTPSEARTAGNAGEAELWIRYINYVQAFGSTHVMILQGKNVHGYDTRTKQNYRVTATLWTSSVSDGYQSSELNLCECPLRSWPLWVTVGVLSGRKEPACTTPSGPGCFDRSARQATMRGPLYCAVLKLNLYPVVAGRGEADPLLSLILSVLMAHWPVRGSYQTEQGGESIQYKVEGTDKKCNGHREDLNLRYL